ncbi:hypothetical protein K32_34470 [Kaistia sp. 32K]|nr:hypothetical protein K32_34470 [Kaistia sp. 32K]
MGSPFDAARPLAPSVKDDEVQPAESGEANPISGFVDTLPAAIYVVDATGRITAYNEAASALWGRRPAPREAMWSGFHRLLRPDLTPMPLEESPVVTALREGRAIVAAEVIAEHPDGSRGFYLSYPKPLFDAEGRVTGAIDMLVDITEKKRSDLSAARLSAIVESSHDAIVSKDLNGIIATWNKGAEALFGYKAEEVIGKPMTIIIPPDRLDEEPAILERIRRGDLVDHFETVRRRKDGSLVDISLTISPVKDPSGVIVGASKVAHDITERRVAEEQQRLILREMSHRIKNLFAIAGSILAMNARVAETPAELARSVRQRLDALTRAHELTRPGLIDENGVARSGASSLRELLEAIFLPYVAERDGSIRTAQIHLDGEDVRVGAGAVSNLALVFNEFATNAAKYGALTAEGGRVSIRWTVEDDKVRVLWQEAGGPAIEQPPVRRGFGSTLADRIIAGQLAGTLEREWQRDGLRLRLELDRARLG